MLALLNNLKPGPQLSHGGHGGGHDEHVDEWHHHEGSEGEPQHEHAGQVNTGIIMKWFVVIVLFVVASIAFIVIYFNYYNARMRAETVETVMSGDYLGYRRLSQQHLSSNGQPASFAGLAGGKVQVPIDGVMEHIVEQYKDGAVKLSTQLPEGHAK